MMSAIYGTSLTKRSRRTKAEIAMLEEALLAIVQEQHPMTVRQVFYQAVSRGLVPKTEVAYQTVVVRLLVRLRKQGRMPYGWIVDETRWVRKPVSFTGLDAALQHVVEYYRRDLWAEAPVHVEIWCEKEALAGVLYEETYRFDVPLMVTKGYPSHSFLYGAAQDILRRGKPTFLYYFGDYDPTGKDIPRYIETTLRELAPSAEIHFERVAVTPEQIVDWNLPTRPTKKTDTRAKRFGDERSVELDAIPPDMLRGLVQECICRHIDKKYLERMAVIEYRERKELKRFAQLWRNGRSEI